MSKRTLGITIALLISFCIAPFVTDVKGQGPTPNAPDASTDTHQVLLPLVTKNANSIRPPTTGAEWPMVAANTERTSWTPEEVTGQLHVVWYRPIEAYISQNVQLIASNGKILVATARGLYALNAGTGEVAWRFDTELPLGNSPTVSAGVVYFGGYDRKLHALNVQTGSQLWEYAGAQAGYDTNPLVIDGKVILGNRDGGLYAIGANGTPDQGQLVWKFQAGGPIHLSPAYKDGIVYFAANDNYAYAVRVATGARVWKSAKLPGEGYHSYWPVIYQDKVIFSTSPAYRSGLEPGTRSILDDSGSPLGTYANVEMRDLFPTEANGTLLGQVTAGQDWSHGNQIIKANRVAEYLEDNPASDAYKHKPWRRTVIVLNTQDGSEYTFDSDGDGHREYAPIVYWGTKSGSRYPPIVGSDGILYFNQLYQKLTDPQGRVMGWQFGTTNFSMIGGQASIVEPQALSSGGNVIYRNLCCDRLGSLFGLQSSGGIPTFSLWSYNLPSVAPGYDSMWTILESGSRLKGWYKGNTSSINGIYHNHGDQNPLIPYLGRVYVHRSNAIIAFSTEPVIGRLPLLTIQSAASTSQPFSDTDIRARLESEVTKIIDSGHLRPGYYNAGQFSLYGEISDYFENPGDTLYTLSIAYPYLSDALQARTRTYLDQVYDAYFDPVLYSSIGWIDGAARDSTTIPPDVQANFSRFPKHEVSYGFTWYYPQFNFYAMWKYALVIPTQAGRLYDLAKTKLQVPVPDMGTASYFQDRPYELNAYIAGYNGFLRLQELAGRTTQDSQLRTQVTNELNRLNALWVTNFRKDTPYLDNYYHKRSMNIARNFVWMTPELGDYLNQNALSRVREAFNEYNYVAPYWFVSRYESMSNEGTMSPLWNYPAMFQAKAFILKASQAELAKYLDAPAFERGDLFYIQDLVAAIEAP
jgi:outer membrane protein assembly factor BamB